MGPVLTFRMGELSGKMPQTRGSTKAALFWEKCFSEEHARVHVKLNEELELLLRL